MSLFIQSIAFKFSFLVLQFHAHNWWCRWCGIKATCSCAHPSPPREIFLSIRWFLAKHNFYRLFVSLDESELVFTAKKSDQSDGGCRWLGFEPTLREGDLLVFGFVFVVFGLRANYEGGGILLYLGLYLFYSGFNPTIWEWGSPSIWVCICIGCIWASSQLYGRADLPDLIFGATGVTGGRVKFLSAV